MTLGSRIPEFQNSRIRDWCILMQILTLSILRNGVAIIGETNWASWRDTVRHVYEWPRSCDVKLTRRYMGPKNMTESVYIRLDGEGKIWKSRIP